MKPQRKKSGSLSGYGTETVDETNNPTSWSSKRAMVSNLGVGKEFLESLANKLMGGNSLTDYEQEMYDSVTLENIAEKEAKTKKDMAEQVESGCITSEERNLLKSQVVSKIEVLNDSASSAGEKKRKIIEANLEKANSRLKMLSDLNPSFSNPLKNEAHIFPLRKEVQVLKEVENSAKGRLMTVKETEMMGKKMDLEMKIEQLERNSRDWFEEDQDFQSRVEDSRRKVRGGKGGGTGGGKGAGIKSKSTSGGGGV